MAYQSPYDTLYRWVTILKNEYQSEAGVTARRSCSRARSRGYIQILLISDAARRKQTMDLFDILMEQYAVRSANGV